MNAQVAEVLEAAVQAVRPLEPLSPSAFAEKHRVVKHGKSAFPGPWLNENAPFLVDVMDAPAEALERGLVGCVLMKPAQVGGSEAWAVNVIAWLMCYFPGPVLYLTARDELAEEISRERWEGADGVIATCAPLARKALSGKKHGEKILVKRFTDAQLTLAGSRSILNFQTKPARFVAIDEVDSCAEEMAEGSDPIALGEHRMKAWAEGGPTLLLAFAHPSAPKRGAAKLYELSDKRRGHVECPHCATSIAPRWDHVQVLAREGESPAEAARNPDRYAFVCPSCGTEWTEADRLKAIRHVRQVSTLPPEIAATRAWLGVHFWRFFARTQGRVTLLAREWVDAQGDEPKLRVFYNKTLAEPYELRELEVTVETWGKLAIADGETGSYRLGEVPEPVQFLTSGQDSRQLELHWAVLGWGLQLAGEGQRVLAGWLVDSGVEPGPSASDPNRKTLEASDLKVFDQVLYARTWPRVGGAGKLAIARGLHDSGWQPIAAYEYCRTRKGRAIPSKGGSHDDHSKAPPWRQSEPISYGLGTRMISDPNLRRLDLNTYLLKCSLVGLVEARFCDEKRVGRQRLTLPSDVPLEVLEQLASERLKVERGRRRWVKTTPDNHWFDCAVMAYALALQIAALMTPATREEAQAKAREKAKRSERANLRRPPPRGGSSSIRTSY